MLHKLGIVLLIKISLWVLKDFFKDDFKGLKVFSNQDEFLNHFFTNDSEYWYSKNQIIADYTNKSVDRYNFIARVNILLKLLVDKKIQIFK